MAGEELPPVIAQFVADVADWIVPLADAVKSLQSFTDRLSESARKAQDFGAESAAAGNEARNAMDAADASARRQSDAESELAKATNTAADSANRQRDAELQNAAAMKAAADAAREAAASDVALTAAQEAEKAAANDTVDPVKQVMKALNDLTTVEKNAAREARNTANAVGFMKTHFQLSGGLFGHAVILGTISGLEIAIHGAIEALAVLIPALGTAAAGLIAWGAAAYQSGMQVYTVMKNAVIVSSALNQTVKPLSGSFQQLADSVRPQVYELFGTYLDMMSHSTGAFNQLIQQTGHFIDHTFAMLEVHMAKGGSGLKNFFEAGAKDLQLFGQILGNIAALFYKMTMAATKTHIAEVLLSIVAAASDLLGLLSKIPAPLLTAFVALHGVALWGGLAVTQLKNLSLAAAQALSGIGALSRPMQLFGQSIGASADQLARMGEASPALKNIADEIAGGVPQAYQMAQAYKVTDEGLTAIVSKTPAVEAAAKAVGASAKDVAQFAVAASSAGVGIEDLAAKTAGGADKLATLTRDLEGGAKDAANMALAFLGMGKSTQDAGEAAATAGEKFAAAGEKTGLFKDGLSGLMAALPGGPVAWLVALGAAIAGVGVYLGMMPDRTQKWINTLNESVNSATDLNVLDKTMAALAANTNELAYAQRTATGNTTELANNQADLTSKLQQEMSHVGQIQKAYGVDLPQALALLQTAGVKTSDLFTKQGNVWQADAEMVHGLVSGYAAMGQQIGSVGSDMNALLVTESQQLKSMGQLNSAYDQFTKLVAAPVSSFLTLDQSMNQFKVDSQQAGAAMTGLGTVTKATAPKMSDAAIQLQQQFQTVYGNVEQLFDAFRNMQAVTGGGGDFTKFVKDAVAALIPLAGTSRTALAEVSSLAQEAGGPATTSLSSLAKWAGNVKNPMQALQNASQQATIATSNLNQDAAQLTNTLQADLSASLAQATENALGGQKALNTFATALMKTGPASKQAIEAGKPVAEMLLSIDKNTSSAKAQFVGWAESMGLSAKQADSLWAKVSAGEKPLASVRNALAKNSEAVTNLGRPGLWGQVEHAVMTFGDQTVGELSWVWHHLIVDGAVAIKNLSNTIMNGVSKFENILYSAGVHVVEGFINGITSMFGSVVHTAESLVSSLGHSVLHALGIGSPSRLAMYWGSMTGEGFVQGLLGKTSAVSMAARQLIAGVPSGLAGWERTFTPATFGTPGLAMMMAAKQAAGGGAPSGNITVNVDGKQLFSIMQSQIYKYNIRNSGSVTGIVKPA